MDSILNNFDMCFIGMFVFMIKIMLIDKSVYWFVVLFFFYKGWIIILIVVFGLFVRSKKMLGDDDKILFLDWIVNCFFIIKDGLF